MFTGLVEEVGCVLCMTEEMLTLWDKSIGKGQILRIEDCFLILQGISLGDSIAINGTCLTVTAFDTTSCSFGVSEET